MHGSKVAALAKVAGAKGETKSQDEQKRAQVAADIQAIYDKTKTETTEILTGLDGKVDSAFSSGEESARKQFEDYVGAKMDAYKDDRYSGWLGGARWLKDKLFGMPDEVNDFYSDGRKGYLTAMDAVIGQVADIVGGELNRARAADRPGPRGRADLRAQAPGRSNRSARTRRASSRPVRPALERGRRQAGRARRHAREEVRRSARRARLAHRGAQGGQPGPRREGARRGRRRHQDDPQAQGHAAGRPRQGGGRHRRTSSPTRSGSSAGSSTASRRASTASSTTSRPTSRTA